jgi:2-hydroxycyclohexanecarboxyl-CoA dehydrogenase
MSESFWVNRDIKMLTENNLIGTMLVCQAFVPLMKAAGSGSVVNSVSPEVTYSTLKAAVVHYTRCLAGIA